jgi:hypothetical protein
MAYLTTFVLIVLIGMSCCHSLVSGSKGGSPGKPSLRDWFGNKNLKDKDCDENGRRKINIPPGLLKKAETDDPKGAKEVFACVSTLNKCFASEQGTCVSSFRTCMTSISSKESFGVKQGIKNLFYALVNLDLCNGRAGTDALPEGDNEGSEPNPDVVDGAPGEAQEGAADPPVSDVVVPPPAVVAPPPAVAAPAPVEPQVQEEDLWGK